MILREWCDYNFPKRPGVLSTFRAVGFDDETTMLRHLDTDEIPSQHGVFLDTPWPVEAEGIVVRYFTLIFERKLAIVVTQVRIEPATKTQVYEGVNLRELWV